MTITAKYEVKDQNLLKSLRHFFKDILQSEDISAILVPQRLPMKDVVMPTLVADPKYLDKTDPLAPFFPFNAAKIVSKLTRKPMGKKVAVTLRPCEIRAFLELVKLKQGCRDEVVVIGLDCLGAYSNKDHSQFVETDSDETTAQFYQSVLNKNDPPFTPDTLAPACRACEHFIADGADILIGLYGVDTKDHIMIQSLTSPGNEIVERFSLPTMAEPPDRKKRIDAILNERITFRDNMFAETGEAINSMEKMTHYFAECVNCYNCRVACPVCYCKECVFVTDVFNHDPTQYLQWANKKGVIKMPTDTVFYQITRLAHMSTACVGCGQCTNACPNNIPVMEVFRTIAQHTQKAFDYEPGRSLNDIPPLAEFREDEFEDVVGIP